MQGPTTIVNHDYGPAREAVQRHYRVYVHSQAVTKAPAASPSCLMLKVCIFVVAYHPYDVRGASSAL